MSTYQPTLNIEADKAVSRDWQNLQSWQFSPSVFIRAGNSLPDWRDELRTRFALSLPKCGLASASFIQTDFKRNLEKSIIGSGILESKV